MTFFGRKWRRKAARARPRASKSGEPGAAPDGDRVNKGGRMRVGPEADRFGAFVMANLRDKAIDFFDGLSCGRWKSARTQPLQAALAAMTFEQRAVVRRCVIAAVDAG